MGTDDSPIDADEVSPFKSDSEFDATAMDVYEDVLERWVISPLRVLWSDYRGRVGLIITTFYILMGTVGIVVVPQPQIGQGPSLLPAFHNMAYPLGTNDLGISLLSLMVHATPAMLKMMLAGALFGNFLGLSVGLFSGYLGGNVDKTLMTMADTVRSIPGLPLLLILAALFEPKNPYLVGVMVSITAWAGLARGIRAQVLPLRKEEYVEASKAMGQPTSNVLIKQIVPDLLPLFTITLFSGAVGVVNASVGLYFLGILPYTRTNWGVVLNNAFNNSGALYSMQSVHWLIVPVVTIGLLLFGLTLLAQAFDQVFNPRVRARHEARKQSNVRDGDDDSGAAASQLEL